MGIQHGNLRQRGLLKLLAQASDALLGKARLADLALEKTQKPLRVLVLGRAYRV
jgi:hypothetical protein